jgi:hypothetical protein
LPPVENGFARINRKFNPGDRITLVLPMKTTLTYWPASGIGIERGPLVYSLPIKEDWTSLVQEKWSTPEFPEWEANPAIPWNYGIAVDDTELLSQIRVEQRPMPADPWVETAIALTVPFRKIPDCQMRTDDKDPNIKLMPPLPQIDRDSLKRTRKGCR